MSSNVLNDEDLELELLCWKCYGNGRHFGPKCEFCNGAGYITTRFGDAILAFVKKHLKEDNNA